MTTPTPWEWNEGSEIHATTPDDGDAFGVVGHFHSPSDARRAVACVNAMAPDGTVAELLAAYELTLRTLENAKIPATPEQANAIGYCFTLVRGNLHRYIQSVRELIEGAGDRNE